MPHFYSRGPDHPLHLQALRRSAAGAVHQSAVGFNGSLKSELEPCLEHQLPTLSLILNLAGQWRQALPMWHSLKYCTAAKVISMHNIQT